MGATIRTGPADRPASVRSATIAGIGWLGTAATYFIAETIVARAFHGYSYARHMISDLGIPYPTVVGGRAVDSPLAGVMNAGFAVQALFFASAAIAVGCALPVRGRAYAVFLSAALVDAMGLMLIAIVHSGAREVADGTVLWHVIGAAMSILGGNLVAMSSSFALAPLGLPRFYRPAGILLGLFGMGSIALLVVGPKVLQAGVVERASVYTITIWELMTATLLLARRRAGPASG